MQGYKFNTKMGFGRPETFKEQGHEILARSFDDYVKQVYDLRVKYGGDLRPNWKLRLATGMCKKKLLPGCEPADLTVRKIGLGDLYQFYKAMMKWKRTRGSLVPPAEAERRAAICADCPMNVPIVGCFGCANVLPKILEMTKGATTSRDAELKGCAVCGCNLASKVHMPPEVLDGSAPGDFPSHCWMA